MTSDFRVGDICRLRNDYAGRPAGSLHRVIDVDRRSGDHRIRTELAHPQGGVVTLHGLDPTDLFERVTLHPGDTVKIADDAGTMPRTADGAAVGYVDDNFFGQTGTITDEDLDEGQYVVRIANLTNTIHGDYLTLLSAGEGAPDEVEKMPFEVGDLVIVGMEAWPGANRNEGSVAPRFLGAEGKITRLADSDMDYWPGSAIVELAAGWRNWIHPTWLKRPVPVVGDTVRIDAHPSTRSRVADPDPENRHGWVAPTFRGATGVLVRAGQGSGSLLDELPEVQLPNGETNYIHPDYFVVTQRKEQSPAEVATEAPAAETPEPDVEAKLRQEIASLKRSFAADLEVISEIMIEEAEDRSWCGEYDEVVTQINARLTNGSLRERERTFTVEVTGTIPVTTTISVVAHSEESAQEQARNEARDLTQSMWDFDLSDLDLDDESEWNVTED